MCTARFHLSYIRNLYLLISPQHTINCCMITSNYSPIYLSSSLPYRSLFCPLYTASMTGPEDSMAMMQIDCEVTATRLLHIHKSAIPSGAHKQTPDNTTFYMNSNPQPAASKGAGAAPKQRGSETRSSSGTHLPRGSP